MVRVWFGHDSGMVRAQLRTVEVAVVVVVVVVVEEVVVVVVVLQHQVSFWTVCGGMVRGMVRGYGSGVWLAHVEHPTLLKTWTHSKCTRPYLYPHLLLSKREVCTQATSISPSEISKMVFIPNSEKDQKGVKEQVASQASFSSKKMYSIPERLIPSVSFRSHNRKMNHCLTYLTVWLIIHSRKKQQEKLGRKTKTLQYAHICPIFPWNEGISLPWAEVVWGCYNLARHIKTCICIYIYIHVNIYGGFLKWGYPQNTPKWSILVGKPMVVGYHHFRKPPYKASRPYTFKWIGFFHKNWIFADP